MRRVHEGLYAQRKAGPSVALSRSPRRPPSRSFGMTRGLRVSAKSERPKAKSEDRDSRSLFPALPAQPNASQDRLAQSRHRSAANIVLIVGQVLALEEHVETLRQRTRHGCAQHEVGAQRQQVLVVIEFVADRKST